MQTTTPYVQVKQKFQVTIPAKLRNKLDIKQWDTLAASIDNWHIVFIPQEIRKKNISNKSESSLKSYVWAGKWLFWSPKEVDIFIRKERNLWD